MSALRRATSRTLDAALLDEARALGVNLSRAAEEGILAQVQAERAHHWKEDNAADIAILSHKPDRIIRVFDVMLTGS